MIQPSLAEIYSGKYVPSFTLISNLDAVNLSTYGNCYWQRIGNTVMVHGILFIDATTAATSAQFYMTLPIECNISYLSQLSGQGICGTGNNKGIRIIGGTGVEQAVCIIDSVPTTEAMQCPFSFQYQIIG